MRKSIKLSLLSLVLISATAFGYAKQKDNAWMCTPGTTGHCMPDFFEPGNYECSVPPGTIDWGDCGGVVEVVIPN